MNQLSELQALLNAANFVSLTDTQSLYGSGERLPLLKITSPLCDAVVSMQGAQLLEFKVKNGSPLLWLSPKAVFTQGKAIRGGIPVCAPWFGVNQAAPHTPKHGFVRTQPWVLSGINENSSGALKLTFEFSSSEADLALFPFAFKLILNMELASQITLSIDATNLSPSPMPFSWALHSYFRVGELSTARVSGLDKQHYLDAVHQFSSHVQEGDVRFSGEVDRVYEGVEQAQTISSTSTIFIEGEHCPSVIVWNPGDVLAAQMQDVGPENHHEFICVERGAAFADSWKVAPSATQSAILMIT